MGWRAYQSFFKALKLCELCSELLYSLSSAYGSGTSVKYFQSESQLFPGGLEGCKPSLKGQLKARTGTKGEMR